VRNFLRLISLLFLFLSFFVKPQLVNALQICEGTIGCGVLQVDCTCSAGSTYNYQCITRDSKCGPALLDTCSCSTNCNSTSDLNCNIKTTKASCESVSSSSCGTGSRCILEQNCEWNCYEVDQGCARLGCAVGTRRICEKDGACNGCLCYSDPTCPQPSPSPVLCTAPTGLGYTRDGTTGVVDALSWTRGTGGTYQYLYVDDTRADVEAGCPGGGGCSGSGCCAIKNTDLGTGATGYSDLSILEAGRLYYWRVVTYAATCQAASATALFVDSCSLSPTSIILRLDDPATPLTSQMYSSTDILRTDFSQTGATVNLSPTSDSAYTYETSVAPLAVGAGTITGTAVLTGSVNDCADTINVSVLEPGPWWQAEDGDVHSNSGDIISNIPAAAIQPYLITGLAGGLTSYAGSLIH
jgi:hypothetical protein